MRTPCEFLVEILECEDFAKSRIDTGWLDRLIAARSARLSHAMPQPPSLPMIVCAALVRTHQRAQRRWLAFAADIGRGRASFSSGALAVQDDVELIHADVKYQFSVWRTDRTTYSVALVALPAQRVQAELCSLADGALLVLLDGRKYVCYAQVRLFLVFEKGPNH